MPLPLAVFTIPDTDFDWVGESFDRAGTNWDLTDPQVPPPIDPTDPGPPVSGAQWAARIAGSPVVLGIDPYEWQDGDGPSIFGWDSVRSSDTPRPGAHGDSSLNADFAASKNIDLPILINEYSENDALAALSALATSWKISSGIVALDLSTPTSEWLVYGRPRRVSPNLKMVKHGLIYVVVRFVATDPIFYSLPRTTLGSLSVTAGGLSLPHSFPHDFGVANAGGVTVTNYGNTDSTRTLIKITVGAGGLSQPSLQLLTTGEILKFNLTMTAGQSLWVDFNAKTAKLDNLASRSGTIERPSSTWWSVPPGSHQVRFGGTGNTAISVTTQSAWLL